MDKSKIEDLEKKLMDIKNEREKSLAEDHLVLSLMDSPNPR